MILLPTIPSPTNWKFDEVADKKAGNLAHCRKDPIEQTINQVG